MKKAINYITLLLFIISASMQAKAQQNEGVVTYERMERWTKIISRLSYMSQEEKDRITNTWKNEDEEWGKSKYLLYFNQNASVYKYKTDEVAEHGYDWRKEEYYIQRDFEHEKRTELIEMLGKTFLLEDSLRTMNWKIMNQLKEVAGHICMKAVTEDTTKKQKITAWFAQDMAVAAGPERYFGLPGLILELDINDGDVTVTATKVDLKKVDEELVLPKKLKGKKINLAAYEGLIANHIKESITAHRNPYWAIRY